MPVIARDQSNNASTQNYRVATAGTTTTFTYDLNGNTLTKVEPGSSWAYEWTAENQLKRVLKNGAAVATYSYDPLGRRLERVAGTTTATWTYAAEDILRQTSAGATTTFVHGPGVDEPWGAEVNGTLAGYYHSDVLRSVIAISDSSGQISATHKYDAYGTLEQGAPSLYAYAGREWDGPSELYYYRARYYDPKIGRFISQDPVGVRGGDINLYAYVWNGPTNFVDPEGLVGMYPDGRSGIGTMVNWLYTQYNDAMAISDGVTQTADTNASLTPGNGGSMDAYRHCLVRCKLNSTLGRAQGFGASVSHEIKNIAQGQTAAELEWDWYNYNKGAQCAANGAGTPGGPSCEDECMKELRSGNLGGSQGVPQVFPIQ